MSMSKALENLQNIDSDDFKRIGTAPLVARCALIFLACLVILGLITQFVIQPQFSRLSRLTSEEQNLRYTLDHEQSKAAHRQAYIEQLKEMEQAFRVMLRQLPDSTDIENLLVDLSQTSVASGLEVNYFKPELEIMQEFYSEYPILISVSGNYHQFGEFVSGIAALPRIVTLSDINIQQVYTNSSSIEADQSQQPADQQLKMDLVATTYRYIEEGQ